MVASSNPPGKKPTLLPYYNNFLKFYGSTDSTSNILKNIPIMGALIIILEANILTLKFTS